ncbi:biliverdin-producing heme oxygenase [Catellatospora sp. KI3]|uniref:biliverdin-producing heme oxygenase n=1 Tax=Catellatospora sp. KI3 TaxID=3041620 RepID=UPI002482E54E|nr:biliverdin-producing heme oxygenase [Catellatospora sp. KI3]MDI1460179.1 biliverdin-producing heme oxygenase [Catellatospora sp. KI3]
MSEPFSARLRAATWTDHKAAEQTTFLDDLTRGRLTVAAHAALTAQYHLIYEVLEEAARSWQGDPIAGVFHHEGLTRLPALAADLEFLLGADWRDALSPVPAAAAYVARLREAAFTDPGAYVAHHYNRYLGDLSGGQYLARALARAYDLTLGGDGLRFYAFDLGDLDAFKNGYRAALDAAPWDEAAQESVVAEVKLAYQLNTDVLADLGRAHPNPFPPEVIAQIMRHMNDDHADDSLLICRAALPEPTRPRTSSAAMSGMDAAGIEFRAVVDGVDTPVRVPFAARLTERAQVRVEVTRLYREACQILGVPAR